MWSLPQDDKTHESAFKNPFHAGVFHQPELGMEHIQYRNADVQAESWRPKSEYSTDNQQENLTHSEFRIIWPGELMNKGCFCYTHRIFFLFWLRKSVNAINTVAGSKFNVGKRSRFLAFGWLLAAVLQSGLIHFVSILCSTSIAVQQILSTSIFPP